MTIRSIAGRAAARSSGHRGRGRSGVVAALALAAAQLAAPSATEAAEGDTLRAVRDRGAVVCGVGGDSPGFAQANSLGAWSGLDVDVCRAVAAAALGDADAVDFVPLGIAERFQALVDARVDVLARNTTWTLSRSADFGAFAGISFYDGQGFMVKKSSGLRSALELDDRPVCVARATTTETNTVDYFSLTGMRYRPVLFDDNESAAAAYIDGECDALTSDRSVLVGYRSEFDAPDAHSVLPEVVSKEPLGPMVRIGDYAWENVVRWSLGCMVSAEELSLTSANAGDRRAATTPDARRLLGLGDEDVGAPLGLPKSWCRTIVEQVGNYGESYARHFGEDSPIGLDRGVNALWTNGGLMYAPPVR